MYNTILGCIDTIINTMTMRAKEFTKRMKYHLSTDPSNIHSSVMVELIGLVQDSGEVAMDMIHRNLTNAAAVAWFSDGGQPVAIAVLKNPKESYRTKVFTAAGVAEQAKDYQRELGYLYVSPNYRGQGRAKELLKIALENSGGGRIYSTTKETNLSSNSLLTQSGFKNVGDPYPSSRGAYNLLLWIKD